MTASEGMRMNIAARSALLLGLVPAWTLLVGVAAKTVWFSLEALPIGKNVTMPQPATTFVPLSKRVVLTGTDMPQTLSFQPVNRASGLLRPLRIAIYDQNSERVQYIRVSPGTPFLYPIKNLSPITVIAEASVAATGLALQVESDKPLDVAH